MKEGSVRLKLEAESDLDYFHSKGVHPKSAKVAWE
jgi:hypothetical protein